jgi:3',5'-cyclic AMP phosphodiesterase CpdA
VKLWATSDLHVGYAENRQAVEQLPAHPDDWLIIAGDTGETPAHLEFVLKTLGKRFERLIWTPGNHDLWTPRDWPSEKRGVAHYERLVALCRSYGVLTPEDPYAKWPGDGPTRAIVPTFLLYDYSFRPPGITRDSAIAWASATGVRSADEDLLAADPYPTRDAWCAARVAATEERLAALPPDAKLIVVNHFPLRQDLAILPRIPRFSIWCGTTKTNDWHRRFNIEASVYGHLHLRSSRVIDGVRFDEVSLGYPKQWNQQRPLADYLRLIVSS